MTQTEYMEQFMADFKARFPTDAEWLAGHPKTAGIWFAEVFSELPLADCLAVSREITAGTIDRWEVYHRDRIATLYRREVRKRRYDARQATESHRMHLKTILAQKSMSEAIDHVKSLTSEARALGKPRPIKAIRDYLDDRFGFDDPSDRSTPRFRCLICEDTGYVDVLTVKTILAIKANPDTTEPIRTCCMACNCEMGNRRAGERQLSGKVVRMRRFGDQPWDISAGDPEARAKAATYEHKPPNFNEALAAFQSEEF